MTGVGEFSNSQYSNLNNKFMSHTTSFNMFYVNANELQPELEFDYKVLYYYKHTH